MICENLADPVSVPALIIFNEAWLEIRVFLGGQMSIEVVTVLK